MVGLQALWLPILLSSIIVFVVSSIIHMLLPWHKSDYARVPNEDKLMDALRPLAIPPGDYMVPRPSGMQEMRSPEFAAEAHRQSLVIANSPYAKEDQDFIDAISDWGGE